jgi:hypothetical protein
METRFIKWKTRAEGGEFRGRRREAATTMHQCRVGSSCQVATARTFLPSTHYLSSQLPSRNLTSSSATATPRTRTSTRNHGRRRQEDTVRPHLQCLSPHLSDCLTGTQSTSGRRPVVGTLNPPTGEQTRPSWASSWVALSQWLGSQAQDWSTATRCLSKSDSSRADSTHLYTAGYRRHRS